MPDKLLRFNNSTDWYVFVLLFFLFTFLLISTYHRKRTIMNLNQLISAWFGFPNASFLMALVLLGWYGNSVRYLLTHWIGQCDLLNCSLSFYLLFYFRKEKITKWIIWVG